jgi:hypothetical protein
VELAVCEKEREGGVVGRFDRESNSLGVVSAVITS